MQKLVFVQSFVQTFGCSHKKLFFYSPTWSPTWPCPWVCPRPPPPWPGVWDKLITASDSESQDDTGDTLDQSEASIRVTWPVLTNQRPVFWLLTNQRSRARISDKPFRVIGDSRRESPFVESPSARWFRRLMCPSRAAGALRGLYL